VQSIWHATVAAALEQDFLASGPGAPNVAELAHRYLLGGPAVAQQAAHDTALAGDRADALFAYREAAARYCAGAEDHAESALALATAHGFALYQARPRGPGLRP
jgi:hypothetical protein